jgi:hypothetical protein
VGEGLMFQDIGIPIFVLKEESDVDFIIEKVSTTGSWNTYINYIEKVCVAGPWYTYINLSLMKNLMFILS